MNLLITLFAILYLGCLESTVIRDNEDDLKAVVVLFRHGDRSPLSSWPNDIYFGNTSLWPDGYGQLNNIGKERHYKLGQWFRERYDGFLPKRYNRNDIYVKSTDVDRTLMSAASNLAGLFPPEGDQVWNSNVPWQAIPIHTVPESNDAILATPSCPKHEQLYNELLDSEEIQTLSNKLANLFQNISEVTGISNVDITSFEGLHSTLTIYKGFNFSLPDWVDEYWPKIVEYGSFDFQLSTYNQDLARLRVGPFFNYLLEYFDSINGNKLVKDKHNSRPGFNQADLKDTVQQKFLMLSAHDTTIADRTNAMGVFQGVVPYFASTVIWELRGNESLYVNMYHKNTTSFNQMTLPACSFDCPLEEFTRILTPIAVAEDQWNSECEG